MGIGRSQPRRMFRACEQHLPGRQPLVSKVRAQHGRGGQLTRPRKPADSATGVACRSGATRPSASGAVLLPDFGATGPTPPPPRQGSCQPWQVRELQSMPDCPAGWEGHPGPLLIAWVAPGLAVPDITTRHPPAARHRGQGRAGEKRRRVLRWPGELLLSLRVPPG